MSTIRANYITDAAGTGSPNFPNGLSVASAALTGTPTAPTASVGTNTTQIATTAFVLANVPAGGTGLTLLGTIATTSGSSVTLSGLTLTSYKQLQYMVLGVSSTTISCQLQLNAYTIGPTGVSSATEVCYGGGTIDLGTGVFFGSATLLSSALVEAGYRQASSGRSGLTTASTSITFTVNGGAFDAGSILIYGVK